MTPQGTVSGSDLEERLRFESMLADLSSGFVIVESDAVDQEIENAQRRVCECLGLDLSDLWQLSPKEPGVLRMTHLYRPMEGPPIPDDFERHLRAAAFRRILAVIELAARRPVVEIDDVASRRGFELVEEILGRNQEKSAKHGIG